MRAHFMPPQVLPAQAPVIIKMVRIPLEKVGHKSKSTVEYPVVEMILATWKAAWRSPSPKVSYIPAMFQVISKMLAATIQKYKRNSSSLITERNWRKRMR